MTQIEFTDPIYFDNAASTPPFPEVLQIYRETEEKYYLNPHAANKYSVIIRNALAEQAQFLLQRLDIGVDGRVVWTSGGTEANNLAIFGTAYLASSLSRLHIVTTTTEHASVYHAYKRLEQEGVLVDWIRVSADGQIDADHFRELLRQETALVTICHVQNETGAIQNLTALRVLLDQRAPNAKLHIDAVQSFGKIPTPWNRIRPDFVSVSGHKVHGPSGVGALIMRGRNTRLRPLFAGGAGDDELRPGMPSVAAAFGLCGAVDIMASRSPVHSAAVQAMNETLRAELARLDDARGRSVRVLFNSGRSGSPYILNVSLPGYEGAVVMRMLGEKGIVVGVGSACSAERTGPSRILTAMGRKRTEAYGALRVSFGYRNTMAQVQTLATALRNVIREY